MKACVSAVSTSLNVNEQRVQRKACILDVASSLAVITGRDTSDRRVSGVSNEEVQNYLQINSAETVSLMMSACMAAVDAALSQTDQAAARAACSENAAKDALAESLGMMKSDISMDTVKEALIYSSQAASLKTAKACMQVHICITQRTHTFECIYFYRLQLPSKTRRHAA